MDAQFPEESLPEIYNALKVEVERTVLDETFSETLWCEVAQHLGGGRVRAVALDPTDGVQRGARMPGRLCTSELPAQLFDRCQFPG